MNDSLLLRINKLQQQCLQALAQAANEQMLEQARIEYLSRNGLISQLMDELKALSVDEKKVVGPVMNAFKQEAQNAYNQKVQEFVARKREQELQKLRHFDVTVDPIGMQKGSLHPATHIMQELLDILVPMGFQFVQGPELEHEAINFDSLNIPAHHPARDMQDTIWLDLPHRLLRTHTSSVQIHSMLEMPLPLAIVAPGRCYRHEATDASHDYVFMQIEGLMVGPDVSMATLIGTIKTLFAKLLNKEDLELRIRPSYFPFVEPGIEVDATCPFCTSGCSTCKHSGWIEMGGAGLVHPNVLKACNIDAEKNIGCAFGFGLTRVMMLKYGIPDIRLLHQNHLSFLKQF
ncbi:MAG: phenylalanine--tRNA ligase subunit alpha [Gammaproteobacteria bacterium]|nr:phenylalanine--tRNA ligase subunit alpha [Gammaproteobacteria bacterium]